mgnify:CR=1 FL=1
MTAAAAQSACEAVPVGEEVTLRTAESGGACLDGCPAVGHIEVHLEHPVSAKLLTLEPIVLVQHGAEVPVTVKLDSKLGIIRVLVDQPLDGSAPYQLQLGPSIQAAMKPNGHLWITPGDPDCDEAWEFQVDEDQDGIPDCSEKVGAYHFGMPLHYWGARVDQTDVFVEVRHMADQPNVSRPWMQPWPQALDKVRQVFADHGVAVHFDVGDLYEQPGHPGWVDGEDWSGVFNLNGDDHQVDYAGNVPWVTPAAQCQTEGPCANGTGWDTWTNDNFLTNYVSMMMPGRERSFYYVLFARRADDGGSGKAHRGGGNAIITLGQSPSFAIQATTNPRNLPADAQEQRNKIINYQASVLMHEMGHMFGLGEGGDTQLEAKPNYFSVMSYVYMFTGLPQNTHDLQQRYANYRSQHLSGWPLHLDECPTIYLSQLENGPLGDPEQFHIGYSNGTASLLWEANLVEQAGIDSTPWGPSGPLDFNCNGATNDLLGPFHITGRGWYTDEKVCGESVHRDDDRVTDHDDWGKLRLYHRERFLSGDWPNAGLPFVCPFPG